MGHELKPMVNFSCGPACTFQNSFVFGDSMKVQRSARPWIQESQALMWNSILTTHQWLCSE